MAKTELERRATVRVYQRKGWRWRMTINGKVIGASTEPYASRFFALKNLRSLTGSPFNVPRYFRGTDVVWRFGLKDRQVELVG